MPRKSPSNLSPKAQACIEKCKKASRKRSPRKSKHSAKKSSRKRSPRKSKRSPRKSKRSPRKSKRSPRKSKRSRVRSSKKSRKSHSPKRRSRVPNLGMFTTEGNKKVQSIINKARREGWTWNKTKKALEELGKATSEATDSAVEEIVYDKLGFDE